MIDLSKLKASTSEMVKPSRNFEGPQFTKIKADLKDFKLFCPTATTSAKLKLFHNAKSGLIAREIVRHRFIYNERKFKVNAPCLKQYGLECPVCSVTRNIQEIKGREVLTNVCTYQRKYISFAYLEEISNHPEDSVKAGQVVLFMYPMTILSKIEEIIKNCSTPEEAQKFFDQNNSISFTLTPTGKPGTDAYNFMPDAVKGQTLLFKEADGEVKFRTLIDSLPSLYDIYLPNEATEDIIKLNKEVADELSKRYLGSNSPDATTAGIIEGEIKKQEILNQIPTPIVQPVVQPVQPIIPEPIPVAQQAVVDPVSQTVTPVQEQAPAATVVQPTPQVSSEPATVSEPVNEVQSTPTVDSSKPDCFGKYSDINAKCLLCPNSTECSTSK